MQNEIVIVRTPISKNEVQQKAEQSFGEFVKAVVDLGRGVMGLGGELHADIESVLLADGSAQKDLWGVNLHPARAGNDWLEFDSMINIRPSQGNRSRDVEDPALRDAIRKAVNALVTG